MTIEDQWVQRALESRKRAIAQMLKHQFNFMASKGFEEDWMKRFGQKKGLEFFKTEWALFEAMCEVARARGLNPEEIAEDLERPLTPLEQEEFEESNIRQRGSGERWEKYAERLFRANLPPESKKRRRKKKKKKTKIRELDLD